VGQTPQTLPTLSSASPSPNPIITSTPEPEPVWQLGHRQQIADLPEYRFQMLVEYPYIEDSQQPEAVGFNGLMNAFVQEEIRSAQSWVTNPDALDGFDAFSEVYYSLPSALGWGQELENADPLNDGHPLDAPLVVFDAGAPILSVLFVNYHYLGGAHPNSYHRAINYDLARAQPLALDDLFQPDALYLERISAYCIDTLTTEMEFYDIWEAGAAPTTENFG
jgi:hypothetical protein